MKILAFVIAFVIGLFVAAVANMIVWLMFQTVKLGPLIIAIIWYFTTKAVYKVLIKKFGYEIVEKNDTKIS